MTDSIVFLRLFEDILEPININTIIDEPETFDEYYEFAVIYLKTYKWKDLFVYLASKGIIVIRCIQFFVYTQISFSVLINSKNEENMSANVAVV